MMCTLLEPVGAEEKNFLGLTAISGPGTMPGMDLEEALKLLSGGPEGIKEWNHRRFKRENVPDLAGAKFPPRADLSCADLREVILSDADLSKAILISANLCRANLNRAILSNANLSSAGLCGTSLFLTSLRGADLRGADLSNANLTGADLRGADLHDVSLGRAQLIESDLSGTNLRGAGLYATVLSDLNLSEAIGLDMVKFSGRCTIGVDTLDRSKGRIPDSFLRGCGLRPWQILEAKAYDPDLTADEFTNLQYDVINVRNRGPIFISGVFISYSHQDVSFADKVYKRLYDEGASVWLDRHDALAGDLNKQISRAIQLNDIVLLVLSKASIESDWVEHELEMARDKEKEEGRDVLCPVALDDAWKSKPKDQLWRQLWKKNVLDFSKWKTKEFKTVFDKLVAGLKINYEPAAGEAPTPS